MASNEDSSDSDNLSDVDISEVDLSDNYFDQRPVAYAFEPLVLASQLSAVTDDSVSNHSSGESEASEQSDTRQDAEDRLHNTAWCKCGHCQVMPTQTESVCCQEMSSITYKLSQNACCITETTSFQNVVVNQEVLDITLLMMSDVRAESLRRPIASRYVNLT